MIVRCKNKHLTLKLTDDHHDIQYILVIRGQVTYMPSRQGHKDEHWRYDMICVETYVADIWFTFLMMGLTKRGVYTICIHSHEVIADFAVSKMNFSVAFISATIYSLVSLSILLSH